MKTYILTDPNDDQGMNDDVIDRIQMTEEEAKERNTKNRIVGIDLRWIPDTE